MSPVVWDSGAGGELGPRLVYCIPLWDSCEETGQLAVGGLMERNDWESDAVEKSREFGPCMVMQRIAMVLRRKGGKSKTTRGASSAYISCAGRCVPLAHHIARA